MSLLSSHQLENHSEEEFDFENLSLSELLSEMENIINQDNIEAYSKKFNLLKEYANNLIQEEILDKKHIFVEAGNDAEDFKYEHPEQSRFSAISSIFREKWDSYKQNLENEQQENLEKKKQIIEKLKNLYTNTEANTNLFRAIREIKDEWANIGQVPKSEAKNVNHNYFHHLNGFYQMLDLNKEFLEQEYAHNLEKRKSIISRAEELISEPSIQKALNELQYLHRLWKEEAEPVAEEFRENTWEKFKEISNQIHDRKQELFAEMEAQQESILAKKNEIIAELKKWTFPKDLSHNYWQQAIKKVKNLRDEFIKLRNVPKSLSKKNWTEFKTALREFNTQKNNFYKELKNSQQENLERKKDLIKIAQDNMNSQYWEAAVPLFKKLQEEWNQIGHIPKNQTKKIWSDFQEACNTFFRNFRENNDIENDNWKDNYHQKKHLLEKLKQVKNEEESVSQIEDIKNEWNKIGKVPKNKMSIHNEFNKILREKLKLNKINEFDLQEEGLSQAQITDRARKMRSQIGDLENEIVHLENNISFFNNPTRENPLLRDTFEKIDNKKAELETLRIALHNIISGE